MKYYQDHMEWIALIHAPFTYADILAMHEYGVPATIAALPAKAGHGPSSKFEPVLVAGCTGDLFKSRGN